MRFEAFQLLIVWEVFVRGRAELIVLLPKGNGKTTLFALLAVFHLLTIPNAECFIAAQDGEAAGEMFRFAQHFVESEPELEALLLVRPSTKEIRARRGQGFIKVLRSDKTQAGAKRHSFNPTLALVDELHAHENPNVYVALRSAAFKRGGLVVVITTAGHNHNTVLGRLRRQMRSVAERGGRVLHDLHVDPRTGRLVPGAGRLTIARTASDRTVMLEWACHGEDHPDGPDDLEDLRLVKLASPASFVTLASLEDAAEAPGIEPWHFARFRANVWTPAFRSWLPAGAWGALFDEDLVDYLLPADVDENDRHLVAAHELPGDAQDVALFLDMARYSDCAALVAVWPRGEGRPPAAKALRIWRSGGPDDPIPYEKPKAAIRAQHAVFELRGVGYDPKYFDQAAEELEGEGVPMVRFDQTNERMCPASKHLRVAIVSGEIRHDGDPTLAAHVAAGVVKHVPPDQFRLVKADGAQAQPVDALIALAGAHELHRVLPTGVERKPFVEVIH